LLLLCRRAAVLGWQQRAHSTQAHLMMCMARRVSELSAWNTESQLSTTVYCMVNLGWASCQSARVAGKYVRGRNADATQCHLLQ
jgi:hypothetical protein